MQQNLYGILIFINVLFCVQGYAQNAKLSSEKEPGWVTVNTIDYNNRTLESEAEDGYFFVNFEKQCSPGRQANYFRKTIKILSDAGVQNSSEISVIFDPAYQQVIFHSIIIIRDGQSINKLQLNKFKIIQQEKELSRHLYDGSLTALLVIDDVRKGDIIESTYTIRGFNPILDNKYSCMFDISYGVPVAFLYYKLIVPAGRSITLKNSKTSISPAISKIADGTVYEWKAKNIAPLHLESKTPEWYNPYGEIMISEYHNWNEVSRWANQLFPKNIKLSPDLLKKINNIKETNNTDETRTLAALHFVQDNIRYMGIEIGVSAHKPGNPNTIFTQRFGDCKDKSYLLVTMLNAMGLAANPVLINTANKKSIKEWLPSNVAFDHCTVQAIISGKVYWFDPTISFQRGPLNAISYPDYQTGLVVNDSTTDLTTIPFTETGFTDVKEIIDVPDMSGKAHLKVITVRTGSYADDSRSDFNNSSLYEIKNQFKEFYAYYFDKIVADSLTYTDDEVTGTFTSTEYYTIKEIWKEKNGVKKLPLSSYIINSIMNEPADKNRNMPFSLAYPAHYIEHLEINMPENWPVDILDEKVQCSGFKLSANSKSTGSNVLLDYEYQSLKDNIMPDEAAAFFTNYKAADAVTGFELTQETSKTSSYTPSKPSSYLSGLGMFTQLYILLGMAVIITYIVKSKRQRN